MLKVSIPNEIIITKFQSKLHVCNWICLFYGSATEIEPTQRNKSSSYNIQENQWRRWWRAWFVEKIEYIVVQIVNLIHENKSQTIKSIFSLNTTLSKPITKIAFMLLANSFSYCLTKQMMFYQKWKIKFFFMRRSFDVIG